MTKEEFAANLAESLEQHQTSRGKVAAAHIDWSKWLQILVSLIQAVGPFLPPGGSVVPPAAKRK